VAWAILDTSVYIDHWERGLHADALADVRRAFIVRHSSVVLSELRRGAHTAKAQRVVMALHRLARAHWEPTAEDWWEAGAVVRKIGNTRTWDRHKRQEFQNDTLIGLTARRHGATVVTANREDFQLLARELRISILPV
jgi:predicted nucleic acid-binding protein